MSNGERLERRRQFAATVDAGSGIRFGYEYIEKDEAASGITCTMSPASSACFAAQWSTWAPAKWPPQRIRVRPPPSGFVAPSQKLDQRVGAHDPFPLGSCNQIGQANADRAHSTIAV